MQEADKDNKEQLLYLNFILLMIAESVSVGERLKI